MVHLICLRYFGVSSCDNIFPACSFDCDDEKRLRLGDSHNCWIKDDKELWCLFHVCPFFCLLFFYRDNMWNSIAFKLLIILNCTNSLYLLCCSPRVQHIHHKAPVCFPVLNQTIQPVITHNSHSQRIIKTTKSRLELSLIGTTLLTERASEVMFVPCFFAVCLLLEGAGLRQRVHFNYGGTVWFKLPTLSEGIREELQLTALSCCALASWAKRGELLNN